MSSGVASGESGALGRRRLPGPRRLVALGAYLLFLLLLAEAAARSFWMIRHGVSFWRPAGILDVFYPELRFASGAPVRRDDAELNILLLGGSVLSNHYGNIGHLIQERLAYLVRRPVTVHNLARTAHTSLDSLYKYAHLDAQRFDLVVFYHGINEARANNVPPELYRSDYSHYAWYASVHSFHAHWEVGWLAAPFTLGHAWRTAGERWGLVPYVPKWKPRPEWLEHGAEIKTAVSFAENLAAFLALLDERDGRALLMSFAYHIPPGYREDAFRALALDYSRHAYPIELWGRPQHVAAAIDTHNAIVERFARASPRARFIDQNRLLPKNAEHFNDVCHLTGKGCERFVEHLLDAALELLGLAPALDRRPLSSTPAP